MDKITLYIICFEYHNITFILYVYDFYRKLTLIILPRVPSVWRFTFTTKEHSKICTHNKDSLYGAWILFKLPFLHKMTNRLFTFINFPLILCPMPFLNLELLFCKIVLYEKWRIALYCMLPYLQFKIFRMLYKTVNELIHRYKRRENFELVYIGWTQKILLMMFIATIFVNICKEDYFFSLDVA